MKHLNIKTMMAMILLWVFIKVPLYAAEYDYVDITNPFLKKSPIAVTPFKDDTGNLTENPISIQSLNLLSDTLVFTGYFKIIEQNVFPVDPGKIDIVVPADDFSKWIRIGAELLITGSLVIEGDVLELELRLYDTFKEKLVVGKRYKGATDDYRRIIHRFCGEILHHITGSSGYFNSKIAFVSTGSGQKEIFFTEFDGVNPVQYTHDKNIVLFPSWSSDGKWIAYTSFLKGKPDLYIRNLTEKTGVVFEKEGVNVAGAWVPGTLTLGVTLSYSGDQEIYLLTESGKIIKRLTYDRGIDVSPSFSPDGKKMAFVSKRSGTPQIYIMDLASETVERLTYYGRYNTEPAWSPKGDKIAYSALNEGKNDIYVIGIKGQPLLRLTRDAGDNESPSWSPDGSLIVFSSTREGPSRIYMMTAFGTDQRRLLVLPGEQSTPRWSPNFAIN